LKIALESSFMEEVEAACDQAEAVGVEDPRVATLRKRANELRTFDRLDC